MHESSKQQQREEKMFRLGLERFQRNEQEARSKGYATSGPLISTVAWQYQKQYADVLRREFERISALPEGKQRVEDTSLRFVLSQFAGMKPGHGDTIPLGEVGFHVLAATVWRQIADTAFTPGVGAQRIELTSEIGKVVELVVEYYQAVRVAKGEIYKQLLENPDDEDLEWILKHMSKLQALVSDKDASYGVRKGRLKGLAAELRQGTGGRETRERGRLIVKRGPKIGTKIYIPEQAQAALHQPWEDPVREMAANGLLSLLVRPKNETMDPEEDQRPFCFVQNTGKTDLVRPRPHFESTLMELKEKLSPYILQNLPLIERPLDWIAHDVEGSDGYGINNHSGGYHSIEVRMLHPAVRCPHEFCETKPGHLTMQLLNKLQECEWRLDQGQLEIVKHVYFDWHTSYDGITRPLPFTVDELKLGVGEAAYLPEVKLRSQIKGRSERLKKKLNRGEELTAEHKALIDQSNANDIALKLLYRKASMAEKLVKSGAAVLGRLDQIGDAAFRYAWNADTRLRVYPIGGIVTPQGTRMERYSLELANGERLTPEGEKMALRAIGTAAIDSKVSPKARENWARENLEFVRYIAEGHDKALEMALKINDQKVDSPLQLIQLSRHWVQHEAGGLWHAPIYADATNSGWAIVAGLLNDSRARAACNIAPADEFTDPADAYRLALNIVIGWLQENSEELLEGKEQKPLPEEERRLLLEVTTGENSALGRSLSKAYATTKIYGSSLWTQVDDVKEKLMGADYSLKDQLVGRFVRLVEKAYRRVMGNVLRYNSMFKAMCGKRLLEGVGPALAMAFTHESKLREAIVRNSRGKSDFTGEDMTRFLGMAENIYKQSTHGLKLEIGTDVVDLVQLVETTQRYDTPLHGRPSYFCRHGETIDLTNTLKAAPPGLIHYLDASILKVALAGNKAYEVTAVHDSCGCHPNHMEDLMASYRQGFKQVAKPGLLSSIADQWGQADVAEEFYAMENGGSKDWVDQVDSFYLMFN